MNDHYSLQKQKKFPLTPIDKKDERNYSSYMIFCLPLKVLTFLLQVIMLLIIVLSLFCGFIIVVFY